MYRKVIDTYIKIIFYFVRGISQPISSKFLYNLEALRGFAAFIVVLTHCIDFSKVLNGLDQRASLWTYEFPGHLAVLLFFVLSGYVIGLTTKQLTWQSTTSYLRKRFLRLYPIYLVGILLALLITHRAYSLVDVSSNLIFLQRVTADPLYEIGVNWSLNYEVLFYLLFIPVSIYAWRPVWVFLASLVFGFFFQLVVPLQLLAMYGFGFCFWVAGLWLARTNYTKPQLASRFTLAGLLLLLLSFGSLNFAQEIMHYTLHLDRARGGNYIYAPTAILFSDFSYLPLGILLVTSFSDKKLQYSNLLTIFVIMMPLCFFLLQLHSGRKQVTEYATKMPAYLIYIASIFLLVIGRLRPQRESNQMPGFVIWMGSISYSVYLFHFIFICILGQVTAFYGTGLSFIARALATIILTLLFSYFMEKKWQPFAIRQLKKLKAFH
jgi:peptidoglycan/LPS O-acetylase OafA/YrhL